MSNEKERNEDYEGDAEKIKWDLNEIRDELLDDLEDLHDEYEEEIEEILEESEEIKEELDDDLRELEVERKTLISEIGDVRGELEDLGEGARERFEKARKKLEHLTEKTHKYEEKLREKVRKKLEKAKKKDSRINISVDPEMSEEWRDWAEGLGASVSELVRKSMKFVKNNIGDITKLEQFGRKMEKMGEKIEKSVKASGIEELGEKIEAQFGKGKIKPKIKVHVEQTADEGKIKKKKRIQGLITLNQKSKSIPIDKLAQALRISKDEAENIIYELAGGDIKGELEGGVFRFANPTEEVIQKLFEMIDNM